MSDDHDQKATTSKKGRKKTKVEIKCRTVFDTNLSQKFYFADLSTALTKLNLTYELRKLPAACCILWEHYNVQPTFTEDKANWAANKQIVRLIASEELKRMSSASILEMCQEIINAFPDACLTLFVLTLNPLQRLAYQNTLIEAQVLLSVRWRLLAYEECALELSRFQKALVEAPAKALKAETENLFKNCVLNHNRKCVRVVENQGLYRLWQQHLLTIPGLTLNITDQIMSKYTCPRQIMEATQDPSIAPGQLFPTSQNVSNKAKVGKTTSSKLYNLYSSRDGNDTFDV